MRRKLRISSKINKPAITITREAIKRKKLVYIVVSNKPVEYLSRKKSRIVYIGTTEKGINRIAGSGAHRAKQILNDPGVKELQFYIAYTKKGKQGVESVWKKLERALIQAFKDLHYEIPILNTQGKNANWEEYYKYFSRSRTKKIIEQYS